MKNLILFLLMFCFVIFSMISCDDDNNDSKSKDSDVSVSDNDQRPDIPDIDEASDEEEIEDADEISDDSEPLDNDISQNECVVIPTANLTMGSYYNNYYDSSISLGGEAADQIDLNFFDYKEDKTKGNSIAGTYDLASDINSNFATCLQCIVIFEDIQDDTGFGKKMYFQKSGTINIAEGVGEEGTSKGTISDVKLIEVELNTATNESLPVENGDCVIIESGSWTSK